MRSKKLLSLILSFFMVISSIPSVMFAPILAQAEVAEIKIVIQDDEKNPVSKTKIIVDTADGEEEAESDADGVATFNLDNGVYEYRIKESSEYWEKSSTFEVTDDVKSFEITLENKVQVIGKVLDGDNNNEVMKTAVVSVSNDESEYSDFKCQDGKYSFRAHKGIKYTVSAEAQGYYQPEIAEITPENNKETLDVTLLKERSKVSYLVTGNGVVKLQDNEVKNEGEVEVIVGTEAEFVAEASEGQHVSKATVTNKTDSTQIYNKIIPDSHKEQNEIKNVIGSFNVQKGKEYLIEIEFSINKYDIKVNDTSKGSFVLDGDKDYISYGENTKVVVAPGALNGISSVIVNGKNVASSDSNFTKTQDDKYEFYLNDVKDDVEINFDDANKKAANLSDILDDNSSLPFKFSNFYKDDDGNLFAMKNSENGYEVVISSDESTISLDESVSTDKSVTVESGDINTIIVRTGTSVDLYTLSGVIVLKDATAPEITVNYPENSDKFISQDDITVEFTAEDKNNDDLASGIMQVLYSEKNDISTAKTANYDAQKNTYTFDVTKEFNGSYYVWAKDNCGNVSNATIIKVVVDKANPEITKFEFDKSSGSVADQVLRFLTFGIFSNGNVDVIVTAKDEAPSSDFKSINISYAVIDDEDNSVEKNATCEASNLISVEENTVSAKFTITEEDFSKMTALKAVAVDNSGRNSKDSYPKVTEDKTVVVSTDADDKTDIQIITKLTATIDDIKLESNNENNIKYDNATDVYFANDEIKLSASLSEKDDHPGFYSVSVEALNNGVVTDITDIVGVDKINEELQNADKKIHSEDVLIDLTGLNGKGIGSGKNEIIISVTNNCGITTKSDPIVFYIDETAPFAPENYTVKLNAAANIPEKVINYLSFGTFFNDNIDITATANDASNEDGSEGSGIDKISLVSSKNPNEVIVTLNKEDDKFVARNVDYSKFDGSEIYAFATDNTGNESETSPIEGVEDLVNGEKTVLSNKLLGEVKAPEIEYEVIRDDSNDTNKVVEYTENSRPVNDTYVADNQPTVNVTATDLESGIYSIDVYLNDNEEPITYSKKDSRVLFGNEGGLTVVNEAEISFVVPKNDEESQADACYKYKIDVVDNCGNKTTQNVTIYTDNHEPVINSIEFEKTSKDLLWARQILNILTLGIFSNNDIKVTVNATDDASTTGLNRIELFAVTESGEVKNITEESISSKDFNSIQNPSDNSHETDVEFRITEDNFKTISDIYAVAYDNAGKFSEATYPYVYENDGSTVLTVTTDKEKATPVQIITEESEKEGFKVVKFESVLTENSENKIYTDSDKNIYYANDEITVNAEFKEEVVCSGFASIKVETVTNSSSGGDKETEKVTDITKDVGVDDINKLIKASKEKIHEQTLALSLKGLFEKGALVSGKNTIRITITNNSGNENVNEISFYIDNGMPSQPNNFTVKLNVAETALEKVIKYLSFGTFFNGNIDITATSLDPANSDNSKGSGVKEIRLIYAPEVSDDIENQIILKYNEKTKCFEANDLNLSLFNYEEVTAYAIDNVGNESLISGIRNFEDIVATGGTAKDDETGKDEVINVQSNYFLGDSKSPTIDYNISVSGQNNNQIAKTDNPSYNQENYTHIVANDSVVTFTITDEEVNDRKAAGIYNVVVEQNNKEITAKDAVVKDVANYGVSDSESNKLNRLLTTKVTVDTSKLVANEDGLFDITIKTVDNAGNESSQNVKLYKDSAYPIVTEFEFVPAPQYDDIKPNENDLYDIVDSTDYGFYFKDDIIVTAYAKDVAQDKECQSSIKSMFIKAVDTDGTIVCEGSLEFTDNVFDSENKEDEKSITLLVPKDFKGQIYSYATDMLGNTTVTVAGSPSNGEPLGNAPKDFDTNKLVNGWMHPNATVIESPQKHEETSDHVTIERKAVTDNTTASGSPLYNKNVKIKIIIKDEYSGIRSINWSVVAPYNTENNQQESIEIPNNTSDIGSEYNGWSIESRSGNLIYQMSKTITVSNDSNDIVIKAQMTDRAGNESACDDTFSIDKTAPEITVTYNDKNIETGNYDGYYSHERTATIKIKERNLDYNDVIRKLSNIDQAYKYNLPKFGKWSKSKLKAGTDPNETIHTFTIKYTSDGTYQFNIKCTDLASNKSVVMGDKCKGREQYSDVFTIDTINPTLSVSYSPNRTNGTSGYFNQTQTATVTIVEHNFNLGNQKEFVNNIVVTNNGGNAVASKPSVKFKKTNKADTYVAEVTFSGTSHYEIRFDYEDMSGRKASTYRSQLDIDKTAPVLEISGIKSNSYNAYNNKGNITPVFKISDADGNLDLSSIVVKLQGADVSRKHNVDNLINDFTTTVKEIKNGMEYTIGYFNQNNRDSMNDDIYTLNITFKDKAGNSYSNTLIFSINRYGSTFRMNSNVLPNSGGISFIKNILNLTFMEEINPDDIKNGDVVIQLDYDQNGTTKTITLELGKDYTFINSTNEDYQWNCYKYQLINDALFSKDGRYVLHIRTRDYATNDNIKDSKEKGGTIEFYIDNSKPLFENFGDNFDSEKVDVLSSAIELENPDVLIDNFDGDNYQVKFFITEETLPTLQVVDSKDIAVTFGGAPVENLQISSENIGDKYEVKFTLPKAESLNDKKDLVVTVSDKAGNQSTINVKELYITNNRFLQLVNNIISNTVLLIIVIVVFVLVVALILFLIFFKRKKNEDE